MRADKGYEFKANAFEAMHTSAAALLKVGAISKATLREFDVSCIAQPIELQGDQIKQLREAQRFSQPIFACHLNTSASTVQKWETGAKRPSGMALKLLAVVQKHGVGVLA